MCKRVLQTHNDVAALVLRLVLGVVFFAHGAQKVLGWYGGHGFEPTLKFFTTQLHIPLVLALLAIGTEFFGGIALVLGFLTRVFAFGIAVDMVVAVCLVHLPNGFFMNWSGTQPGEGYEYHLLAIAMALALLIKGGGAFSLDRYFSKR